MSDSPPPTQVPLRDSLLDTPRSLLPPVASSPGLDGRDLREPRDTTPPPLMPSSDGSLSAVSAALSNGHPPGMSPASVAHAGALGHQFQVAALAAAQMHYSSMQQMAAQAHHRASHHHPSLPLSPMSQLMRKTLPGPGHHIPGLGPHHKPGGYTGRSPPPPHHPLTAPPGAGPDSNACKLIKYREREVAAFMVEGRELICLPQAFELFLKDLVGGLHTVYTKLKRLDITPVVCNVEQVRVLRGLGAIQPGVNRCKLISCDEFDILYDDCTNSK